MSPEPISTSPKAFARRMAEDAPGHGHGMSRNRTPKSDKGLPHDEKRDEKQPYSREVEDYSGGVTQTPESRTERDCDNRPVQDT